ncbi:hypothetical protein PNF30_16210 [Bacillus safensis]|uniref:hypothetical protein n=1 Tax=Bacillus TaxID=1386 RepID=UPI002342C134|nr:MULTISPECIES: hypothetical protein [Bacillus]MEC3814154.1 hypothetical protein [Bacillus altitudinis]WCL57022.1 hypothetical protein PNF30_16210 [Bacillus safensis]
MKIRQRLIKLEKLLPEQLKLEKRKIDPTISWLINNNEEFKNCLKQLWRLSLKAGQNSFQKDSWPEPYRGQVNIIQVRMNEIYEQHSESEFTSSV